MSIWKKCKGWSDLHWDSAVKLSHCGDLESLIRPCHAKGWTHSIQSNWASVLHTLIRISPRVLRTSLIVWWLALNLLIYKSVSETGTLKLFYSTFQNWHQQLNNSRTNSCFSSLYDVATIHGQPISKHQVQRSASHGPEHQWTAKILKLNDTRKKKPEEKRWIPMTYATSFLTTDRWTLRNDHTLD